MLPALLTQLLLQPQAPSSIPPAFWISEGLEYVSSPEARIVPGPRLRLVGGEMKLQTRKGETIELAPARLPVIERPLEVVLVSGTRILTKVPWLGRKPLPPLAFTVEDPGTSRIRYVVLDDRNKNYTVAGVEVNAGGAAPEGPPMALKGEQIVPTGGSARCLVFYGQELLGRMKGETFSIDARRLQPGYHEFFTVPVLENGAYGVAKMSTVWVQPRFQLETPAEPVRLEGRTLSARVKARLQSERPVAAIHLYCGNRLVASCSGASLDTEVQLTNYPTSTQKFDVVAEYADGARSAAEGFQIKIINPISDSLAAANERAKRLKALMNAAEGLDEGIVYWYERARAEPASVSYSRAFVYTSEEWGRFATVALCQTIQLSGRAGEYMGKCVALVMRRASLKCDVGELLVDLGRIQEARAWLIDAIREAGEGSAVARRAEKNFRSLERPTSKS